MHKKKEKTLPKWLRLAARVCIISMPAAIVLAILLLTKEITLTTAALLFVAVLVVTTVITSSVFKELENFISYLKKLAQGFDIEPPRFHKGIFSSFRLADTFQSVKNRWLSQTLSDARILENLPDPLLMVDEKGVFVFVNQKAKAIFGAHILKKKKADVFGEDVPAKALEAVLKETVATELFEWHFPPYIFQVRIDRLPAPTRDGAVAVMTLNDITPFKRFREQQADFFANASHELKTPLSIISGLIETLQGPAKDDEDARQKFLSMMAEQTVRMTGLVQDLLLLSRQQMTLESSRDEVIILPDLIQGVMRDLNLKAKRAHKQLVLHKKHEIPRLIGSRSELQHVFQNLIDNAIKYGAENSVITIEMSLSDGFPRRSDDKRQTVAIAIHNTGKPIAAKHIEKLFDRFYRVDSIETKQVEGTGLGLGIAQQIVHEHDGVIDVTSSAREGTTFTVYLPVDL